MKDKVLKNNEEPSIIEINSAIDLSKHRSNSLIVAKIEKSVLENEEMYNAMRKLFDDLRLKVDIDDTTHFMITAEEVDIYSWTEQDLSEIGWSKNK
jgi:hypothetical protein